MVQSVSANVRFAALDDDGDLLVGQADSVTARTGTHFPQTTARDYDTLMDEAYDLMTPELVTILLEEQGYTGVEQVSTIVIHDLDSSEEYPEADERD